MAKKKKEAWRIFDKPAKGDRVGEIFAPWGKKENFFTSSARAIGILGPRGKRARQRSVPGISGSGRVDKETPGIAGSGRRAGDVPDVSGRRRDRSKSDIPDIAGSGGKNRGVPDIGGDGRTGDVPDIGGQRNIKDRDKVPGIGAAGKRGKDAGLPDIGGDGLDDNVIQISGAIGTERKRKRKGQDKRPGLGGDGGWNTGTGFRAMTQQEEAEYMLFVRRVDQVGIPMTRSMQSSWQANIMLDKMKVEELWNTPIGAEVQRLYGAKGADLDQPADDRPRRQFIPQEERKSNGLLDRLKSLWGKVFD